MARAAEARPHLAQGTPTTPKTQKTYIRQDTKPKLAQFRHYKAQTRQDENRLSEEFKQELSKLKYNNEISIATLNCRGVVCEGTTAKKELLIHLMKTTKTDILLLQETHVNTN